MTADELRISDWSSDVCSYDQAENDRAVIVQPQQCRQLFGLRKIELQRIGQMLALDGDDSLVVLAATLGLDQQAEPTTRQQGGEITLRIGIRLRSEERRVGKEGVSTFRSRWSPFH